MSTFTTATVTVSLEIRVNDSWGDNCTVAQVKKQAADSANGILRRAVETEGNITVKGTVECTDIHYKVKS